MISREPKPNQPERITTNFSVDQGKPVKGFHLEGKMLEDSPFGRRKEDAPATFERNELGVTYPTNNPAQYAAEQALHGFGRREHPIETGRPQPSDQAVKAALERQRSERDA